MYRISGILSLLCIIACGEINQQGEQALEEPATLLPAPCIDSLFYTKAGMELSTADSSLWEIKFRQRGIPIKQINFIDWYFNRDCATETTLLDSLILILENGTQSIQPFEYEARNDQEIFRPKINFVDFNFDSYLDFRIFSAPFSGMQNHIYAYYLYDPETSSFEFSEVLSQTSNLHVDEETGTLKTFQSSGHSGMIFRASTYIFRKDSLYELNRQEQEYDAAQNVYLLSYYELRNGNFKHIDTDTIGPNGTKLGYE